MQDTTTLNRPYVYMVDNTFKRNLSYTAGGAVHIRSTRRKQTEVNTNLKGIYDAGPINPGSPKWNDSTWTTKPEVCGLVNIQNNVFERNQGINSQTVGGAIVTACDFMDANWKFFSSSDAGSFMGSGNFLERELRTKINYLSAPPAEDTDFYTYVY